MERELKEESALFVENLSNNALALFNGSDAQEIYEDVNLKYEEVKMQLHVKDQELQTQNFITFNEIKKLQSDIERLNSLNSRLAEQNAKLLTGVELESQDFIDELADKAIQVYNGQSSATLNLSEAQIELEKLRLQLQELQNQYFQTDSQARNLATDLRQMNIEKERIMNENEALASRVDDLS